MAKKFKIKKGDRVVVVTGRDRGKQGEVLRVLRQEDRLLRATRVGSSTRRRRSTSRTSPMSIRPITGRPGSATSCSRMAARSGSPSAPAK
jgi:acid phosphatase class B